MVNLIAANSNQMMVVDRFPHRTRIHDDLRIPLCLATDPYSGHIKICGSPVARLRVGASAEPAHIQGVFRVTGDASDLHISGTVSAPHQNNVVFIRDLGTRVARATF